MQISQHWWNKLIVMKKISIVFLLIWCHFPNNRGKLKKIVLFLLYMSFRWGIFETENIRQQLSNPAAAADHTVTHFLWTQLPVPLHWKALIKKWHGQLMLREKVVHSFIQSVSLRIAFILIGFFSPLEWSVFCHYVTSYFKEGSGIVKFQKCCGWHQKMKIT